MKNLFYSFIAVSLLCLGSVSVSAQVQGQRPLMEISRNNGYTPGIGKLPVVEDDTLGRLQFRGWVTGLKYHPGAELRSYVNGPVTADGFPANLLFLTGNPTLINRMIITDIGYVGINTYTPQQLFTLSHATEPIFRFDRSAAGEMDYEFYNGSDGKLFFRGGADAVGAGLTDFMVLDNIGRLGLGTTSPQRLFTLSAPTVPIFRFDQSAGGANDMELSLNPAGGLQFSGGADGIVLNDYMILTEAGRLGVGTNTPDELLTIAATSEPAIRLEQTTAGSNDVEMTLNAAGGLQFSGGNDGNTLNDYMVLTEDGRLGLGTTMPDRLLTVSATNEPAIRLDQSAGTANDVELLVSAAGDLQFYGGADGVVLDQLMTLKATGKLAIGTDETPDQVGGTDISAYTVYAQGGMLTDELRVRTGWADFVFEPDYQLPTLASVAAFIDEHGHLPAMASGEEVTQQGLNVGSNAAAQQQKIEEIFLYLIEMKAEITALQAENQSLRAKLEAANK